MIGARRWKASQVRRWLVPVLVGLALVGAGAGPAYAHPLGNFTVNRYSGIVVSPDQISIEHVLDLAEVPTAQLGERVQDLPALARRMCARAARTVSVRLDRQPVELVVERATARTRPGEAGLPVLRVECELQATIEGLGGATEVAVRDTTADERLGWREMTARGDGVTLVASDVEENSASNRLSNYPRTLLEDPLDVRSATLTVRAGGPAVEASQVESPETVPLEAVSGLATRIAGMVAEPGLGVALLALLLAFALGAGHALAPGHGKTVMAFYLANRHEGSLRAAFGVGAAVTFAHTASVLALGVVVSTGAVLAPASLYPWLTAVSGMLILALGVGLLFSARRGGHLQGHGHGHGHGHSHGQEHGHTHVHHHDHGHGYDHRLGHRDRHDDRRRSSWLGVTTLGLAGGIVPSPSALLLLLVAVGLQRPEFGAILVAVFGVGMAVTLGLVGIFAAQVTGRLQRWRSAPTRISRLAGVGLRYGTAGGVCAIGAGIVVRALVTV